MTKKEIIWREILCQAVASKKLSFTQKELAEHYGFSLSTVFNALKNLRAAGIVAVHGRGFTVLDWEKMLYFWATARNLTRETAYQTRTEKTVRTIEGEMPPGVIFGAFSAYAKKYHDPPADYDRVYVYASADELPAVKQRFPPNRGYPNVVVLREDPSLASYGNLTPDPQTFVDLWNISAWYAKDFLEALKEKFR